MIPPTSAAFDATNDAYHAQSMAIVCDFATKVELLENGITFSIAGNQEHIDFENILCINKTDQDGRKFKVHFIKDHQYPTHKLTTEEYEITSEGCVFGEIERIIKGKIEATRRPHKLVIFINPIGGQGRGEQTCKDVIRPVLELAEIQSDVIVSTRAGYAKKFAETYDFKTVDGMVIMGGDGTISEILNVLMRKTQEDAGVDLNDPNTCLKTLEFPISVMPTGTGNGLAYVAYGCSDALTTTLHIVRGKTRKFDLVGCFNENKMVDYSVLCVIYGMINDHKSLDVYWKNSRYFIIRRLGLIFAPILYFLWKPAREMNVEVTSEYLSGHEPKSLIDDENASVTVNKRISSILTMAYDMHLDKVLKDVQPQYKDQFDVLTYTKCGKLRAMTHFANIGKLTEEHLDTVTDFVEYSKVTGFHLRVTDDNDPADSELNLNFMIDGEMYKLKTPDIYLRLFPRCFNIYTSYKGPRRFW